MRTTPSAVEALTVRYGDLVAVDDVSFAARRGEVTAVLGPNGAGKTSTIEVCEGYRRATAGTVRVLGLDPGRQQRQLSERMGVMLQEGGVYPSVRVIDAVRHHVALAGTTVDPRGARRAGRADQPVDGHLAAAQRRRAASACRWPWRWPPSPTSPSSTSRRRVSTSTAATRSAASSAAWRRAAAPSSWRRTSWTRPSASPIAP